MDYLILVIFGIFVIVILVKLMLSRSSHVDTEKTQYQYRKKDFLMSPAEQHFFNILIASVGDQYYIFPQIHLDTILDQKIKGQNWNAARHHINQKSIDFIICDKVSVKPVLAVELVDRTHEREDRTLRDEEVTRLLTEAGLPIIFFGNIHNFKEEDIKQQIIEVLKK